MKHYLHPALLASNGHCVTVDLIGAGGTGSSLLTNLARIHLSLLARGHLGLHVRVFDPDHVEQANLVRQHFTKHDLGRNKAEVAVERLNRFYGLNWQAYPLRWDENWVKAPQSLYPFANILVSCVDTVKSRRVIADQVKKHLGNKWAMCFADDGSIDTTATRTPAHQPLYWLDMGNARDTGQVLLSTLGRIPQPTSYGKGEFFGIRHGQVVPPLRVLHPGHELEKVISQKWQGTLPNIFDFFPDLEDEQQEDVPSCSLIDALGKQSIMVNPMMATMGANLLAQMFEQTILDYRGCYINLSSFKAAPIPIK